MNDHLILVLVGLCLLCGLCSGISMVGSESDEDILVLIWNSLSYWQIISTQVCVLTWISRKFLTWWTLQLVNFAVNQSVAGQKRFTEPTEMFALWKGYEFNSKEHGTRRWIPMVSSKLYLSTSKNALQSSWLVVLMKEFYLNATELHMTTRETHFIRWQKFFRSLSFVAHPRGMQTQWSKEENKKLHIPTDKRFFVNSLWRHNIEVKGTKAVIVSSIDDTIQIYQRRFVTHCVGSSTLWIMFRCSRRFSSCFNLSAKVLIRVALSLG